MPATFPTETTRDGLFVSTRWTMVLDTGESQTLPDAPVRYEEMSLRLGRPITTLRSDVARLRSKYRAILREEVGGTVAKASEVDAELRHLCEVLASE
jgi:hypothetical protein